MLPDFVSGAAECSDDMLPDFVSGAAECSKSRNGLFRGIEHLKKDDLMAVKQASYFIRAELRLQDGISRRLITIKHSGAYSSLVEHQSVFLKPVLLTVISLLRHMPVKMLQTETVMSLWTTIAHCRMMRAFLLMELHMDCIDECLHEDDAGEDCRSAGYAKTELAPYERMQRLLEFGRSVNALSIELLHPREALISRMHDAFALICQASPRQSPVGYLMNPSMRGKATAAMNSAILEFLGLPAQSVLDRHFHRAREMRHELALAQVGAAMFADVEKMVLCEELVARKVITSLKIACWSILWRSNEGMNEADADSMESAKNASHGHQTSEFMFSPSAKDKEVCERLKKLYPYVDQEKTPLPRFWSAQDKCTWLLISNDALRVTYNGQGKNPKDAGAVRSNHPIPVTCGVFYFEVLVVSSENDCCIGIGLCEKNVDLNRLPGWDKCSYGYHGDDGNFFCSSGSGSPYGRTFSSNDTVGCGINLVSKSIFSRKME
uniref:B30.2/SPRY domain-containing protein n=1 Tax=Ascaris lumbricoides TaxID=6252 RepID=A0A9J2Q6H6_ASCLU